MTKLLYAGAYRYAKSRIFRLVLILNAILAAHHGFESGRVYFKDIWAYVGVFMMAAVIGLNMGGEYENGGFRNKTVIGHSRSALFFSELLLAMGAAAVLTVEYGLIFLAFNLYVLRDLPAAYSVQMLLSFLGIALSMSALFVFFGALAKNRAVLLILCVLAMLLMIFLGEWLWNELAQDEMTLAYETRMETWTAPDGTEHAEIELVPGTERYVPNPHYVGGPLRVVYETAWYLMPCGMIDILENALNYREALSYSARDPENGRFDPETFRLSDDYQRVLDLAPWGCLAVLMLSASGGWLLFRKKEFI